LAYENITNKKFLNGAGVGKLWELIRARYDSKLDNVVAADGSVSVTNNNQVAVKISTESDNILQLKTGANAGLYVGAVSSESYAIERAEDSGDYAAVYQLKRYANGSATGVNAGVAINIPKDMVVSSGAVVEKSESGTWGAAGTYIELTLANATNDKLYIPVGGLIEYVTSGSTANDMVVINIDSATHQVTASITDGSITKAKLSTALQNVMDNAITSVTEGATDGTISVNGVEVAVHGLRSAAYANANSFDAAGAAAAVLGANTDTSATNTVYGVKQYASDAYAAILALTNTEIDNAVAAANATIDA